MAFDAATELSSMQAAGGFSEHPEMVASLVRGGLEHHVIVQQHRLAGDAQPPSVDSEAFARLLKTRGFDEATDVGLLWELATHVLAALESPTGPQTPIGHPFLQWAAHCAQQLPVQAARDVLHQPHALVFEEWGSVFDTAERQFFCGNRDVCADLLDECRVRLAHDRDLTGEESMLFQDASNVVRQPYWDHDSFTEWHRAADRLMVAARPVFGLASQQDASDGLVLFKLFLLDLVAICTGDRHTMLDVAVKHAVGPVVYAAGAAVVVEPCATMWFMATAMQEYTEAVENAEAENADLPVGAELTPWYTPCVERLLRCRSLHEVVAAVSGLRDDVPPTEPAPVHFATSYMTAHVSDLCAPVLVGLGRPASQALALRHRAMTEYLSLVLPDATLWAAVGTYLAFSPLADPSLVARFAATSAAAAKGPGAEAVLAFLREWFDGAAPFQRRLREVTAAIAHGAPTLADIHAHYDATVTAAIREVARIAAAHATEAGQWTLAVQYLSDVGAWPALQALLEDKVQAWGRAVAADPCVTDDVALIGEAVQEGFIDVAAAPDDVAALLRLCSSLATVAAAATDELRRAAPPAEVGAASAAAVDVLASPPACIARSPAATAALLDIALSVRQPLLQALRVQPAIAKLGGLDTAAARRLRLRAQEALVNAR